MQSPTRRSLAALAAAAFTATAAVGLAAAPAQAQPSEFPIVDGSIDWGVKESFRNYVTSPIAQGEITTGDGATAGDDGTYRFPVTDGTYDVATHDVVAQSEGQVRFWGHDGELDLAFSDLRVETDHAAETGVLYLDVTDAEGTDEDVPFADLDFSGLEWEQGEYTSVADVPAALTAEGAEAFAGFYSEGQELDPVSIAVAAGEPGTGDETETPDGEDPGSEDPEESTPAEDEQVGGVLEIVDGHADWGIKESFRSYVTGPIADGEIDTADGASENGNGTFRFTGAEGTFDSDTGELDAAFDGTVHFTGHDGELDLSVSDVALRGTGDDLSLYVGGTELAELAEVELDAVDGGLSVSGAAATLTEDGADFFAAEVNGQETRFYEAGEELDPVSFALAFDEDVDLDDLDPAGTDDGNGGVGVPKLPTTGAELTWVLAAAGALVAGGAAVMVLARRRALAA
ncbi:HtaA domain-containing protein [Glycomyces salinus]|uniref:HtaA domain-containing protein n=1 Tax=Glycomyces salinus TaxID=980294 RepID=UPI0018ED44BB|nr:HtaA domain-containing protein [Glycomyces salinus]